MQPFITVAMPAYNAEKYIEQAIRSILRQTFREFILMIINDGSTDKTEAIVMSFKDPRIQYIRNDENIGLVRTLNRSIELTRTEYYARMDADDIAMDDRLQTQFDFMNSNRNVDVCGGSFEILENGVKRKSNVWLKDDEIKAGLLFDCHICHPTVMIRTSLLKGNGFRFGVPFSYDDAFGHKILELEDFALWHKLKSVATFRNLEQILITYRREGQNLSSQKADLILERKKKFFSFYLNELRLVPSAQDLMLHISPGNFRLSGNKADIKSFRKHLNAIAAANKKQQIYPEEAMTIVIAEKWKQLFYHVVPNGFNYVFYYWKQSGMIPASQLLYFLKFSIKKLIDKK